MCAECSRVLKPGGHFIYVTYAPAIMLRTWRNKHSPHSTYQRVYAPCPVISKTRMCIRALLHNAAFPTHIHTHAMHTHNTHARTHYTRTPYTRTIHSRTIRTHTIHTHTIRTRTIRTPSSVLILCLV